MVARFAFEHANPGEDMGQYFRVAADNRDLNCDEPSVQGGVQTQVEESYASHDTVRDFDADARWQLNQNILHINLRNFMQMSIVFLHK